MRTLQQLYLNIRGLSTVISTSKYPTQFKNNDNYSYTQLCIPLFTASSTCMACPTDLVLP